MRSFEIMKALTDMDDELLLRTEMDLLTFAKEQGGHYIRGEDISDGVLVFDVYQWVEYDDGDPTTFAADGTFYQSYYYRLDGTMSQPEVAVYTYNCSLRCDLEQQ